MTEQNISRSKKRRMIKNGEGTRKKRDVENEQKKKIRKGAGSK